MDRAWGKRAAVCGLGMAALCGLLATASSRRAEGTDWLTGAGNRAAFRHALERKRPAGGLVLVRLWGMEELNRTMGYRAGDAALAHAAECLRLACGTGSALYRIGGRTFAAVLPGEDGPAPDQAAARTARSYGPGQAGERLMVSWAEGPATVRRLLRRAGERLLRAL